VGLFAEQQTIKTLQTFISIEQNRSFEVTKEMIID